MKCMDLNRPILFACCAVAGMVLISGCESITPAGFSIDGTDVSFDSKRELMEPIRSGEFATFKFPELRRIEEVPSQIVFPSELDKVYMTKRMLWGTSETVADVLGIGVRRNEGMVKSEITVNIAIYDVLKNVTCHEKTYQGVAEMPWDGGGLVPDSVYKCVQNVASSFLKDIAANRTLIARLEGISPDASKIHKPSFKSFEVKPKNDSGVVRGTCILACNDWDEGRAASWLRAQLERRCENQLGVESSRVRLVYDKSAFKGDTREWEVSFTAFARSEMVLNYDSVTLSGTCVADFGLMGKSAEKAADALKAYVMQEMDKRAGAQESGREGGKALVRFDDFKTDQHNTLTYCSFRLVY